MKSTSVLILLLLGFNATAQVRAISKIEQIEVDGYPKEWHQTSSLIFSSNDTPESQVIKRASIDQINDLHVVIKLAWNEKGLAAFIDWRDNVIDTEFIPKERSIWYDANNRGRDRLYFFDDFAIRILRGDSYYYGAWLTTSESQPLQWHSLRNGPRGTPSIEVPAPLIKSRQVDTNHYFIEAFWTWETLNWRPKNSDKFDIIFIVGDGDNPQMTIPEKANRVKYYGTPRLPFTFGNR